jgi:murein DD-endopeptidase MepM/ murein hydrolase activator NlpD
MTARFLSMTAMVFVAAIAVATSVPANALLSAQDVEDRNGAAAQNLVTAQQNGQSVEASGENVVAGRDGVSVTGAEPVKAYVDFSSNRIFPVVPESSGSILWPFPAPVPLTDGYGARANFWTWGGWTGNFHSGLDFDVDYGTPIQSVADGIVVEVSSTLCGQAVVVSHNVGGQKFDSEYCHMIYGSPNVIVGQSISAGTVIGNVGQTGMATGPHLHLEIHIDGNAIDPMPFLEAHSKEW